MCPEYKEAWEQMLAPAIKSLLRASYPSCSLCGLCASSRRVTGKLVRNAKSQDCPRSTQSKPTLQQGFQVSQTHTKVGDILSTLQPHQNVHKGLELAMFHALIHAIPRPRTPFLCLEYPVTFYSFKTHLKYVLFWEAFLTRSAGGAQPPYTNQYLVYCLQHLPHKCTCHTDPKLRLYNPPPLLENMHHPFYACNQQSIAIGLFLTLSQPFGGT